MPHQVQMYRERVRTIGISLLGGNSGVEGPYELGIDSIRAVNIEDVTDRSSLGALAPHISRPTFSDPPSMWQRKYPQKARNGRDRRYYSLRGTEEYFCMCYILLSAIRILHFLLCKRQRCAHILAQVILT